MKMMTPKSEAELVEMVAGAEGSLWVRGGGTRGLGGAGSVLGISGITGVKLYEPGALTLVVRAGTPVTEVEAALAAENQRLAFEPMDHRGLLGTTGEPTIGGVVAGNISGPRRVQAGACRDFLLGVRFVDGAGQVVRNGGRVMKNVTGYDLVKLMAGSWGTLGILTEVALKVLPRPESEATLTVATADATGAVKSMATALGSPFEVSGAAFDPEAGVRIRIEGFESSVSYRAARLEEVLAPFGEVNVESAAAGSVAIWDALRDVAPFHGVPGDVWRLSVKPTDAPEVAARLRAERLLYDWGGGLIWALVTEGTDLRARMGGVAGHATLVRASEITRARLGMFQPEPEPLRRISEGLRARFDPRGILNPGLMRSPQEA